MKYTVLFLIVSCCRLAAKAQDSLTSAIVPSDRRPFVRHIYPSAERIPANVLRFYIEFSEPMRDGDALARIHIIDENGMKVPLVFFDNGEELWNPERTKLTLLVDPGRVKTGLKGNKLLGRAFKEGSSYQVVVDTGFQSISGNPLRAGARKSFIVVKADTLAPDLRKWQIRTPPANMHEALVINFGKPLDHISALGYVIVINHVGLKLSGQVLLRESESAWSFYPEKRWVKGHYQVIVNSRLEDLSGNNLNGAFDHAKNGLKNKTEGLTESLWFEIRQGTFKLKGRQDGYQK